MGHRANFVVIREGQAQAYSDHWAALGCIHCVSDGPDDAAAMAAEFEATDELLDWAFMEGGYLVDFDEKLLIVFGLTEEDLGDEFSEWEEDEENEQEEADDAPWVSGLTDDAEGSLDGDADEEWDKDAERAAAEAFLRGIAPKWKGWTLRWDQRGADAFAEHLVRKQMTRIRTQPLSAEVCLTVELKA
jgi:glycine/D-amino acid oxidase-like deaminating enzyme